MYMSVGENIQKDVVVSFQIFQDGENICFFNFYNHILRHLKKLGTMLKLHFIAILDILKSNENILTNLRGLFVINNCYCQGVQPLFSKQLLKKETNLLKITCGNLRKKYISYKYHLKT